MSDVKVKLLEITTSSFIELFEFGRKINIQLKSQVETLVILAGYDKFVSVIFS